MTKRLCIFDFDGTLFRSPEKPDWWPEKGWWSKAESLGPPCVPEHPGSDWWVSSTVEAAKAAISDPDTYAVLITGRLAGKFHKRVPELLKQAGLRFDEVHLTPGGGTLPFKLKVIEALLQKLAVEKVEVWEDRAEHVGAFKSLVEQFGIESEIHLVTTHAHPLECTQESMPQRVVARYLKALEEEPKTVRPPAVLYHATSPSFLPSIVEHGIRSKSGMSRFGPDQMGVSTTKSLRVASSGAFGNLILEIKTAGLKFAFYEVQHPSAGDEDEIRVVDATREETVIPFSHVTAIYRIAPSLASYERKELPKLAPGRKLFTVWRGKVTPVEEEKKLG